MLKDVAYLVLYGVIFTSLFIIDYTLGNGLIDMFYKLICKSLCFLKKAIRYEIEHATVEETQIPVHIPTLLIEILVLIFTRMMLNKYKFSNKGKDRLDELINESKETLRITDEFLEKWRMRRIPTERSYLDEEPRYIKPLKLEVPILHMAIIDACGSSRKKLIERGDSGDSASFSDPAFFSEVCLIEQESDNSLENKVSDDINVPGEFQNRYLWDVEEEDSTVEY